MPSYLDLAALGIILISACLSLIRGFAREVFTILSWTVATFLAYYFYPMLLPQVANYIHNEHVALGVAIGGVFLTTLILVSILTVNISDRILDSKIGALDRSLGFVFGAARGFLLCVLAFIFFSWLVPERSQPEWVLTSKFRPYLRHSGERLLSLLPSEPDKSFLQPFTDVLQKNNDSNPKEGEHSPDSAPPPPSKSPPPAPSPQKRTSFPSSSPSVALPKLPLDGAKMAPISEQDHEALEALMQPSE